MTTNSAARRFFIVLLIGSAILLAAVVRPLAGALFTAVAFAAVLQPLHRALSSRMRNSPRLAAAIVLFSLVVLAVGPLVALSTFVVTESAEGAKFVAETVRSEGVKGLVEHLPSSLRAPVMRALKRLPDNPKEYIDSALGQQVSQQGTKAATAVGGFVVATGSVLFEITMMLIALYFLLVEGRAFIAWLDSVSPLRRGQTHELLAEFRKVSYAIIVSTLITSAIQAAAALAGYLITSVPHPLFFTGVTFAVAFVPAIGAASVVQVAALLLLVTGHPYGALFLSLWGFVVVGLVDNIAKPWLIKHDIEMSGAVVFFALIGGLGAFGAIGLLIGPLAVSFFMALLRMYQRDFMGDPDAPEVALPGSSAPEAAPEKTKP